MERRDFIKISALSGVMATLEGCRSAEKQLIRFVPEEELVPGIATWKPSVCPLCSAGCGLQVRVMQGEAEVVEGLFLSRGVWSAGKLINVPHPPPPSFSGLTRESVAGPDSRIIVRRA